MKIVTILGARPQFIKAANLSRLITKYDDINEVIVHTGQHYDQNMSDIFFEEMEIPVPDYHLGIGGGSHGSQTGNMLIKIEQMLESEMPDYVLVYGDTNSTLAGALAASKMHIPVIHVEAGLRSFNMKMPEEQNRILTDALSSFLFIPTPAAGANLEREGVEPSKIYNVGDIMFDSALFYGKKNKQESYISKLPNITSKNYILATIHRAENTDNEVRLKSIFEQLDKLSEEFKIILPLHPRTKSALQRINYDFDSSDILFVDPVGYLDMVELEKNAGLIITDSGGVQKEAYFHGVCCLTLRDETEWVELVDNGYNYLVKDLEKIPDLVVENYKRVISTDSDLYGKGDTSKRILQILRERHS